ncbi:hypothetical protein LS72_005410 [Helicobacter apodemus]|uniref:Uncharacterized protein n=1 Tax=Helicobacter apodemus TaxID=135569 RepID=A0A4U8UDD2_9HELI|nr:hypothetical protein LS72_005410 [Helicobacter apodemus]
MVSYINAFAKICSLEVIRIKNQMMIASVKPNTPRKHTIIPNNDVFALIDFNTYTIKSRIITNIANSICGSCYRAIEADIISNKN